MSPAIFDKRKNTREAKSDINYDPTKRYPYSILEYSGQEAECNNGNRIHPTQKPVALYEYLIRTYTNEGETVLDCCAGSGTTGVACVKTGRNFIGIEKEPKYFEIAERRIKEAQMQLPLMDESREAWTR